MPGSHPVTSPTTVSVAPTSTESGSMVISVTAHGDACGSATGEPTGPVAHPASARAARSRNAAPSRRRRRVIIQLDRLEVVPRGVLALGVEFVDERDERVLDGDEPVVVSLRDQAHAAVDR